MENILLKVWTVLNQREFEKFEDRRQQLKSEQWTLINEYIDIYPDVNSALQAAKARVGDLVLVELHIDRDTCFKALDHAIYGMQLDISVWPGAIMGVPTDRTTLS